MKRSVSNLIDSTFAADDFVQKLYQLLLSWGQPQQNGCHTRVGGYPCVSTLLKTVVFR